MEYPVGQVSISHNGVDVRDVVTPVPVTERTQNGVKNAILKL